MRFLLPLLFCLSAWAQPDPIWKKLLAVPSEIPPFTPRSIPNLSYWWVSSDVPTNINVTNWTDRIQGAIYTNGTTGASRPTNSALGMHFSRASSQILTNNVISLGGTNTGSYWIIMRRDFSGGFQDFLDYANSGDSEWYFDNVNQMSIDAATVIKNIGAQAASTFFDAYLISDNANVRTSLYTNGVLGATFTTYTALNFQKPLGFIMGGILNNGFLDGYIKELGIWTNTIFTTIQISNLHYYTTNTYPITP